MSKSKSRPPTSRQLRVGENIRHAVAEILARYALYDDLLEGAGITVSEVRVSPDLKTAKVYVMPLGGDRQQEIVERLEMRAPEIRRLVAARVHQKYSTKLFFRLDKSFEEAEHINNLLKSPDVQRDIQAAREREGQYSEGGNQ